MKKVNTMGNKSKYIIGVGLIATMLVSGTVINGAHAESSSANASVTVANTITLTLTGGDLVINNLTPGNASDSNVITASVTSNSPYGFHLSATTGTSGGTTSLVNTADNNFTFTNLNGNKATLANFSDNTWGYSYSTDGTNWISGDYGAAATAGYNGLNLDGNDDGATGTTLFNSDSYLGSKSVQFKIGAKSATTQAAGTYTNTVNFYVVTNPEPAPYMQDLTSTKLNQLLPNVGDTTTAVDKRDEQAYTIAKLADNKYWMVENLNLAGGTTLSANDTDVTSAYISSFSTSNNLTKTGDTIVIPASSILGFDTDNYSYVYNSGNKTNCGANGQNIPCYSYYSWDLATLGSGRSISTDNENAEQSICPKNWKLPSTYNGINSTTDFRALMIALGGSESAQTYNSNTTPLGSEMSTVLRSLPNNFLFAGLYVNGSFNAGGSFGYYWSSTSYSDIGSARRFSLGSGSVGSFDDNYRKVGMSVRCLCSGQ